MMALWVRPDLENIFGKFSSCSSFHNQKMRKKKKYENCAKSRCLTCFWRKKETDKCTFFFYLKTIGNRVLFIYLCIFERALTIHTQIHFEHTNSLKIKTKSAFVRDVAYAGLLFTHFRLWNVVLIQAINICKFKKITLKSYFFLHF